MKRSAIIFLSVLIFAAIITPGNLVSAGETPVNGTYQASQTSEVVSVHVGEARGTPDSVVRVAFWANISSTLGYNAEVRFNSSVLEFVSIQGVDFPNPVFAVDNTTGRIRFAQYNTTGVDDPVFVVMRFRIRSDTPPTTTRLAINRSQTAVTNDPNGTSTPIDTYENGNITVIPSENDPPTIKTVTFGPTAGHSRGTTVPVNDTLIVNTTVSDNSNIAAVEAILTAEQTIFTTKTAATKKSGIWTADIDTSKSVVPDDGPYTLSVRVEDTEGNINTTTVGTILLDRKAPILGTSLSKLSGTRGRVKITSVESLKGKPNIRVTLPNGTTITPTLKRSAKRQWTGRFRFPKDFNGTYALQAVGRDQAGNRGTSHAKTTIQAITTANNAASVQTANGAHIALNTTRDVSGSVSITESDSPPTKQSTENLPGNSVSAAFLDVSLASTIDKSLANASVKVPVQDANGTDKENVTLHRYNASINTWEPLTPTSVRTIDGTEYWVAAVPHFSTIGALGTDTHAPAITSTTPTDGTKFQAGTSRVAVRFDYRDMGSGVDTDAVTLTIDGNRVTPDQRTSRFVTYTAGGFTDGSNHTARVTVMDKAGNDQQASTKFSIASSETSEGNDIDGDAGDGSEESSSATGGSERSASNGGDSGGSSGGGGGGGGTRSTDVQVVAQPNAVMITVQDAPRGLPVKIPIPQTEVGKETGGRLTRITTHMTDPMSFTMVVSSNRRLPEAVPALGTGGSAITYFGVEHEFQDRKLDHAELRFRVARVRLDELDQSPKSVTVFRFNTSTTTWDEFNPSITNSTDAYYEFTASVQRLSVFAIGVKAPPSIAISDVSINESRISVGNWTKITATVNNTGGQRGTFRAELSINSTVVTRRNVTVPAGSTRTVTFVRQFRRSGTFVINVSGTSARTLSVEPRTPSRTPSPTSTPTHTPPSTPSPTASPTDPPPPTSSPSATRTPLTTTIREPGFVPLSPTLTLLAFTILTLYLYRRRYE